MPWKYTQEQGFLQQLRDVQLLVAYYVKGTEADGCIQSFCETQKKWPFG